MNLSDLSIESQIHIQGLKVSKAESNLKIGSPMFPEHIQGWQRGLKWETDRLNALTNLLPSL